MQRDESQMRPRLHFVVSIRAAAVVLQDLANAITKLCRAWGFQAREKSVA